MDRLSYEELDDLYEELNHAIKEMRKSSDSEERVYDEAYQACLKVSEAVFEALQRQTDARLRERGYVFDEV